MKTISEEKVTQALNKAFEKAGQNAYFGNGFRMGVKFAMEQIKNDGEGQREKLVCDCPEHTYYEEEKRKNICYECGKPLYTN